MSATLAVIGFGSMGSAIVRGGLEAGVLDARATLVIDPQEARRSEAAALGCRTMPAISGDVEADQILLAVKPQKWPEAVRHLGALPTPRIVISIMAGIGSSQILAALGAQARIIRAMPNIPCSVRAGATALALGVGAARGDEQFARRLFKALGVVVEVDESLMNAATALNGSGPAYVFLLAEAMEQAGVQIGLDRRAARTLAYHTILGAGRLLTEEKDVTADALRAAVTSPGGTTAAALELLFERELPQIVADAIVAARDRGQELGASPPER